MKAKILGILGISILSVNLFAAVVANDIVCAFGESAEKKYIEDNVIDGATHYLISNSNATLLLCEFEKSAKTEFSNDMALEYTEKAIESLKISIAYYKTARDIGQRIGYSAQKENWFKSFDYEGYIKQNNLNSTIATKVKNQLSEFDILGIYQQNIDNLNDILSTLILIRSELKGNLKPSTALFWKLFQQYSEASLFGNYATVMGKTILGNCGS